MAESSPKRGILVLLVERVPLVDHALARFAAAVPEHAALILAVVGAVVIRGIHQGDVCVEVRYPWRSRISPRAA